MIGATIKENTTFAFIDTLKKIHQEGTESTTRSFWQKEIIGELLKIRKPYERVIITPSRNNNIFALVAETFWVLGGRNDLDFLTRYLPRAVDFSDDGKTWRAAYGPRLRNWKGVDQVKEVARLLNRDPSTKRAVISIFNPELDYVESNDIPCNNWLHFMNRNGELNLNVSLRANDAIWGFGGINSFEWSVLQEIVAFWTQTKIGTLSWYTSTIHIYERHFETSIRMIERFPNRTVYDFGIRSPKFETSVENFDSRLAKFFEVESLFRSSSGVDIEKILELFNDDFFRESVKMLYAYNEHLKGSHISKVASIIEGMTTCDLKIAAIEYFSRLYKSEDLFKLNSAERAFFDFYHGSSHS